jgi:large subunit ribosomal protein L25
MSEITLNGEIRKELGRRSKALRRSGKVPGIYYGHGQQNISISLLEPALKPLYTTTATHVINLKLDDGSSHMCILRDIQLDPVTERPVHFDLFGLSDAEEIKLQVPVKLTGGIPKGVREGGILQQILHKIKIACLPKNIPDHFEVNVGELEINHSIHIKDIKIENIRILEDERSTIVAVVPPVVIKEPEPVAGAVVAETAETAAEPEVITKGKKVEEGAEAAPEKEKAKEKK